MALGIGFGSDKSRTDSNAWSEQNAWSASAQNIWGPQAAWLQQMYGGAGNLMAQQAPGMQRAAQGMVNQAMPGLQRGYGRLGDVAAGGGPLAQYARPNNALAAQQARQASQQIGQQFREQVLPGIRGQAGLVGGMGSAREGVAQGMAADSAQRNMANATTDLYAQQYGIGAQAAAGLQDSMLSASGQMPAYAANMSNLGMMPYQAAWAPYQMAGGLFGDPRVMTQQQMSSWQQTHDISMSSSKGSKFNFGL